MTELERRGIFETLFGRKPAVPGQLTQLKMLNAYTPYFMSYSGEPYDNDIVRSAVHAVASNAAKLTPRHIRRQGGAISNTDSDLEWTLQYRPNPYMNTYDFLYKTVTQLLLTNNAFVYVQRDDFTGKPVAFYPLNSIGVDLLEAEGDEETVYAKFYFMSGKTVVVPYDDIIHLRRHFYKNDMYGETHNTALTPILQLITTINSGIINAVKSSAYLRGLLKFTQNMMKPEDIKKQRDDFIADYMDITNNGGVAALDAKADYTELKGDPKLVDDKTMSLVRDQVYRFFNISENIVMSNYNEEQWNAFYESVIEPLAVQMSLEFTTKVFSDKELGYGNEIVFEANRLQYASAKTKIQLAAQLGPLGMFTIDELREVFNLPPLPDGEGAKRMQTLNVVDANKANKYQIGEDDDGSENDQAGASDSAPGDGSAGGDGNGE